MPLKTAPNLLDPPQPAPTVEAPIPQIALANPNTYNNSITITQTLLELANSNKTIQTRSLNNIPSPTTKINSPH